MADSTQGDVVGNTTAYIYRFDGTLEWSSRSDLAERSLTCFDAIRHRLGLRSYAELREHGISAHRLVSTHDRATERCLVVVAAVSGHPQRARDVRLSPRRREVAELAAVGATAIEIAAHMTISPHTVRQHLKSVYRELGVANRVELVRALAEIELA
ncbi:MAG: LuxR C-terminal-related transcriptional regulator [Sandaracinaceae bacterium]